MCQSCKTQPGETCLCHGGDGLFSVCPASQGYNCYVCNHPPQRATFTDADIFGQVLHPDILKELRKQENINRAREG